MTNTCTAEEIIPPIIGAAIGIITSAPVPDDHMIGNSPSRATATVISLKGLVNYCPGNGDTLLLTTGELVR